MAKHYSYQVYENHSIAEQFDREKFGGSVGSIFKDHQESVILSRIPDIKSHRILDLGAGTGRISLPLSRAGGEVYAADYSLPMIQTAREKSILQGFRVRCLRADAHDLPFEDNYFHAAVSLRMIMHVVDWQAVIRELCRVSRKRVIVDFPPIVGFAGIAPLVHSVKRRCIRNYQPYNVFTISRIADEFRKHGFEPVHVDRHLVLPFALHRFIGSPVFTQKTEGFMRAVGITDLLGAPVTMTAERRVS